MNSLPLSLSSPTSGTGNRSRTRCTALPTRSWFLPQTASIHPRRPDVDRAERTEVEALRARAAVGDQIDFQEAGPGVVPVGERADRNLLPQQMAGVRDGGAAPWVLRPRRLQ